MNPLTKMIDDLLAAGFQPLFGYSHNCWVITLLRDSEPFIVICGRDLSELLVAADDFLASMMVLV